MRHQLSIVMAKHIGDVLTPELAVVMVKELMAMSSDIKADDLCMAHKVERLEDALMALPQPELKISHAWAPGLWARSIELPAGTVIVGAVHRTDNLVQLSMGSLQCIAEDGTVVTRHAGDVWLCRKGMKNTVVALEDCKWTNFMHNPSDETNVDKLVEMFSHAKADELIGGAKNRQLLAQQASNIELEG